MMKLIFIYLFRKNVGSEQPGAVKELMVLESGRWAEPS